LRQGPCNYENMPKRPKKSVVVEELEPEGSGIVAAIAQDIELTAEQIKDVAQRAVVAVEKIAGIRRTRKSSKPREAVAKKPAAKKAATKKPIAKKAAMKKVQRKLPRTKAVAAKAVKRKAPKSKTKR
jgi:hypothetical protein